MILIRFHEGPKDGLTVDATREMAGMDYPPRTLECETVFDVDLLHVYEFVTGTRFLDVNGESHILHYKHKGMLVREGKEFRYNGREEEV